MTVVSRFVFFKKEKKTQLSSDRIRTSEISIVIPVKDNQRGVNNYLDAFFASHNSNNFPKEIIIIDNNSTVPLFIERKHKDKPLSIKLISCKTPGPGAARNLGVKRSSGEWILFNDSDCIPTKEFLSGYLSADNNSIAYAGNIKPFKNDQLSKYYESQEILIPLKTYEQGVATPQYLITANTLIWKEAFEKIGGFNEEIKIAGGEDIDLGLRLSEVGNLSYAFDSMILHDFNDGLIGFYNRFKRYGKGNRIVEEIWKTNMRPNVFRPNQRTPFNETMAFLQYLFLLGGYLRQDYRIKRRNK